jgi:hypothetical protein
LPRKSVPDRIADLEFGAGPLTDQHFRQNA